MTCPPPYRSARPLHGVTPATAPLLAIFCASPGSVRRTLPLDRVTLLFQARQGRRGRRACRLDARRGRIAWVLSSSASVYRSKDHEGQKERIKNVPHDVRQVRIAWQAESATNPIVQNPRASGRVKAGGPWSMFVVDTAFSRQTARFV
jgi:hypothetical protein